MSDVRTLSPGGIVTRKEQAAFIDMEKAIIKAIAEANQVGVPQGLIVAALAGHFHVQTQRMVDDA